MSAATRQPRNLVPAAMMFAAAITSSDQKLVFPAALAIVVARAGWYSPLRPRAIRLSRWA